MTEGKKEFDIKLQSVIDAIKDPVFILDLKTKQILYNSAAPLLTELAWNFNLSAECLRNDNKLCNCCCLFPHSAVQKRCIVKQSLNQNHPTVDIFNLRFRDNTFKYVKISSDATPGSLVIHARLSAGPFVAYKDHDFSNPAQIDSLTGLPNIFFMENALSRNIARMKRDSKRLAVLFIDIRRFRNMNAFLGREGGDDILKEVSSRIKRMLSTSDMVCRQGSDVFVAIITDAGPLQNILAVARKIIKVMSAPVVIKGEEVKVNVCIGLSVFPEDGSDATTLLKNADTALQTAKNKGLSTFHLYEKEMDIEAGEMLLIENKIYNALDNNEFVLYYQPQTETTTGKIVGAEALIRWNSPALGMISPLKFIPLAEELGIIIEIGRWVIDTACRQARDWADKNFPCICVSVNVSMKQFRDPELVSFIFKTLNKYNLPSHWLGIELTENQIMENPRMVIKTMQEVSECGMKISIDDFGTGYSSLGYLKDLPVSKLKIDKTFISNITKDAADEAIVRSIINLSHNFKLKVNAEGVETSEQVEFLRNLGCDELQGYFLSKPLLAEHFEKLWNGMLPQL